MKEKNTFVFGLACLLPENSHMHIHTHTHKSAEIASDLLFYSFFYPFSEEGDLSVANLLLVLCGLWAAIVSQLRTLIQFPISACGGEI